MVFTIKKKEVKLYDAVDLTGTSLEDVAQVIAECGNLIAVSKGSNGISGAIFFIRGGVGKVIRPCPLLYALLGEKNY